MTERFEEWSLTRETIGSDRLSVILCGRRGDGSDDAVTAVAALFRERGIDAEIVCVPATGGPGASLKAAFARATGAYVLTLEGDIVARANVTPSFFASLVRDRADVAVGSKRHPKSVVNYPWHRRLASAAYFAAVRVLLGVSVSDTESGMMLWRRGVLADALGRMLVKSGAFALELLTIARTRGAKVTTAPVVVLDASFGVLRWKMVKRALIDTLALVYRQRLLGYYEKAMAPAPLAEPPLVSVVIPCPKSTWMLEECLAAMTRQTYGNWECIVLPDEGEGERQETRDASGGEGERRETRDASGGEGARQETRDASGGEGERQEIRDASGDERHETKEVSSLASSPSGLSPRVSCPAGPSGLSPRVSCPAESSGLSPRVSCPAEPSGLSPRVSCPAGPSRLSSLVSCPAGPSGLSPRVSCPAGPSGLSPRVSCPDPRIHFLATGKIRPAEKRNLGVRAAKGEIIAFIDDDAYPDAHWLEYAIRYFGDPEIGAVGGPGVTPPGDTRLARLGGRVYDNVLVSGNYRYRYKAGGVRRDVEDYPSCNLFVRKSLLDRIGGYRTDFWPGEDTLLCKDIVDLWKRIVYDPWVVVYHHRRPLFLPHLRQLGRYGFHRGYFCKRFPSNSLRLSYFIPTAFDAYLVALVPIVLIAPLWLSLVALAPLALYAALVLATTAAWNPFDWLLTAAGVVLSHVWYGLQFILGLCARRAPCEYIGGDHASATHDEAKKGMENEP